MCGECTLIYRKIENRVHQNGDASGNNLRNSSVDADTGSVVLADTTICRVGIFSFVRRTKRSLDSRERQKSGMKAMPRPIRAISISRSLLLNST